jgi:prepilin-type N-terminal cleavage/methylation domain-containing protein
VLDNIRRLAATKKSLDEKGFTLIELVIGVGIMGIIAVTLLGTLTYYFANMTRNNHFIEMTVNSQNFLRVTVEELRYGAGVRQSNTVTDAHEPSGGWDTSNDSFVIIIAVPAIDSDREYIIDPLTGYPYNNELVYFRQGDLLYKRTLANPDASGNTLTTSCPAASANASCPADKLLLEDLDEIEFTLYDQDNTQTTNALLARSVKIDLTLTRDSFGQPQSLDNTIRTTLRNRFQ